MMCYVRLGLWKNDEIAQNCLWSPCTHFLLPPISSFWSPLLSTLGVLMVLSSYPLQSHAKLSSDPICQAYSKSDFRLKEKTATPDDNFSKVLKRC